MSSVYYYFAASLPMLEFGKKPPFAMKEFLEECQRLLAPRDFMDIMCAVHMDGKDAHNTTLKNYLDFERCLRNELVMVRARQLGKDPSAFVRGERGIETAIVDAVNQAMKISDPLIAEKVLDQARWQRLDDLLLGHFFDLDFLAIYALKLKILVRYKQIESKQGLEDFEKYKQDFINQKIVYT